MMNTSWSYIAIACWLLTGFIYPCYIAYYGYKDTNRWFVINLNFFNNMPTDKELNSAENISTGLLLLKFWPIVAAVTVGLISLGGVYVKVDFIAESIKRNDTQFNVINDRQNLTSNSMIELRSQISNLQESNSRNAQAIIEVNSKLEKVIDKQRWAPK